ncbi:chromosome segregation ATPase [Ordospora colligata]|uniref:Chromosome segregation ATPase n=1 Tax=Ordospora colligata OC4 TaxID=1354746 RepID=A0A0B2ULR8_9MICR|nr:chromosome segregation ATPase [Ordospora colligata OC4]KHN69940.1 chromosome segregation ATPase [Ordospora colligata OC4]TBU16110.1 chromosome segregation ATPase [Ordospora colligata]TBU16323.1 chromosome segregation ATPase [Ordospora colligata]TBU19027.1 chromosome segregation ATPase [Ordospora colligata]
MGLEKIEVENFKSYRGKHLIGPFDRLTCVIGPNGSGKSNVMDAITFCLGVGAWRLRTSSVRGVINEGSGYASVTLHIATNSWTRMLYRRVDVNGRSSYAVDDDSVGYDKFQEALQQMNVMMDARNFMVFQGDVGKVGRMAPMEITRLFEEMSGSGELKDIYEEKARIQSKALSDCAMLFEERKDLCIRMKEAEEVKEQEEEFRRMIARKTSLQREITIHELYRKVNDIKEICTRKQGIDKEVKEVQGCIDCKEREIAQYRSRMNEARREYFEANSRVSKQRELIKEKQMIVCKNEHDEESRRAQMMDIDYRMKAKQIFIVEKTKEIAKRNKELEEVCKECGRLEMMELDRMQALECTRQIEELYEKEKTMQSMCGSDIKMLDLLDLEEYPKKILKGEYIEKLNMLKEKNEQYQDSLNEIRKARSNLVFKIDNLNESEQRLREKIGMHEAKYDRLAEEEKEKNARLTELLGEILRIKGRKRIDSKRSIIKATVGTLKTMFPGVYGCVVDLIRPTQDRYEVALSMLFGSHDLSVVVDTEATAVSCINFVRDKRLCKMTFLPLQSMNSDVKGTGDVLKDIRATNGVRMARDTVEYDLKYKKVVMYLLNDKLISDSLDVSRSICYGKGMKMSVCSLDGVYIHGGGCLMTGGGCQRNRFEEDELDSLMKSRSEVLCDLKKIHDMKAELSHVEICRERILVWNASKCKEMDELKRIDVEIDKLEKKLIEIDHQEKEVLEGLNNLDKEICAVEQKKLMLGNKLCETESKVFEGVFPNKYFGSYKEYKEAKSNDVFTRRLVECEGLKLRIRSRIAGLDQEMSGIAEEIEIMNEERKWLSRTIEGDAIDMNLMSRELIDLESDESAKAKEMEVIRNESKDMNNEFRKLVCKRNELDKEAVNCMSAKERLEEEVKNIMMFSAMEEIAIPYVGGEMSMDNIDFSEVSGDAEQLEREFEEINMKMERHAPPKRMESTENDRSKYMKINSEYERLKEAAIKAKSEFNDVKKKRTGMFAECFEKVNKEVSRIYKALTTTDTSEGNAYLVLENQAEPYKGGVGFHLMPPSKRFREMRLLSGGERTMATLSLLFSFHSYRPAPFYVFDEIDSALDKENVARIISFMLSCNAQFILITLRPTIFQHSDSLVGIYKDPYAHSSRILTYRLNSEY